MMRALTVAATAICLAAVAACERQAEEPPPEPAADASATAESPAVASIRARQTHYKQIGKSMKAIGDELKAGDPSVQDIRMNAAQIAEYAPQVLAWFPAGSGAEAGLKTRAKQEIWSDPEGFRSAAEKFIQASERFHDVTMTGDLAAIRAAQGELGQACKNCHEDFRAPEE